MISVSITFMAHRTVMFNAWRLEIDISLCQVISKLVC